MEMYQELLNIALEAAILVFESLGLIVVAVAGIMGAVNYVRKDAFTRLKLAKGFALGLEFKLGGEILRTVLVRQLSEIMIVGSIIILRAALTFLINWEIESEEHNYKFGEKLNGLEEQLQEIEEQVQQIETNEQELTVSINGLEERDQAFTAQLHELEERDQVLTEQLQELEERDQELTEQLQELEEQTQEIIGE